MAVIAPSTLRKAPHESQVTSVRWAATSAVMSKSLTFFGPASEAGADLLENWVRPVCERRGVRLTLPPRGSNRGAGLRAHLISGLVLWDCSLDGPHDVYRSLIMQAKHSAKHLLASRTPMPRNILAKRQCAPIHGHLLDNASIGRWLDRELHRSFGGAPPPADELVAIARHYWLFDTPADYFLSFRGTHEEQAREWRAEFERTNATTVRMVPPNEYSYPTEVLTRQQAWEGTARLFHEMKATTRVVVYDSPDYFDSFWTATEMLNTLWLLGRDRKTQQPGIRGAYFAARKPDPALTPFRDGLLAAGIPTLRDGESDRFVHLINNSDPYTAAPEATVPARGLGKLLAAAVRHWGYYLPEFQDRAFWDTIWIPCQHCKPHHREPASVDWSEHMRRPCDSRVADHYGYFPADRAALHAGTLRCPTCHTTSVLVNDKGVRTLWKPVQTTETDQDRPVIETQPVWEVVP